jgi:hypothetical protein
VRTTLTLAVSWYIVATFIGLYANRITHSIRRVMPRTLLAWAIAGPIALTTRILLFDRPFDLAFSLVALGVTGALLVTWRAVYALVPRKRSAED